MRAIKFRGRRLDNSDWAFGGYYGDDKRAWIVTVTPTEYGRSILKHEVDLSTVGQYIGLPDKNGIKVFDGDIVRMHFFFENYHPVSLGAFEDEQEIVCKLSITPLGVYFENETMTGYLCDYLQEPTEELEVIGNIHEAKEGEE